MPVSGRMIFRGRREDFLLKKVSKGFRQREVLDEVCVLDGGDSSGAKSLAKFGAKFC